MVIWHETPAARIGLRVGGLAVLSFAWGVGSVLYARVHAHPPRPADLGELGLCLVLFALLVAGGALAFVGATLWREVPYGIAVLGLADEVTVPPDTLTIRAAAPAPAACAIARRAQTARRAR